MNELLDLMRLNEKNSPWIQERTFDELAEYLQGELSELRAEKDSARIEDELGDVLRGVFILISKAEKKGWFTGEELLVSAKKKFLSRKPWILKEHKLSSDEEVALWNKAKEKE